MASYNTAILHLANYYLEHHDEISRYYLDGAIDMIHNIYGVREFPQICIRLPTF